MINEKIDKILLQEYPVKEGLNYLMPTLWWDSFCFQNFNTKDIQNLVYPDLQTDNYVETFLYDFQGHIIEQLESKCNYLKFNRILISPEIKKNVGWKAISPKLWKKISLKKKKIKPILTILTSDNVQQTLFDNFIQFQIVYCSKAGSEVFVGFLSENVPLLNAVREIGYDMGFIEMQNSRITYPDKNPSTTYMFQQKQKTTLKGAIDTIIMVFNLEKQKVQDSQAEIQFSFNNGNMMNNSNEALAGDLGMIANESWEQLQNERTLSTGAETPFFSFSRSDRDHLEDFRVRELFRQKKPEQIAQMKIQADSAIHGELIPLPTVQEQKEYELLEKISDNILEQIQQKKKSSKEKELHE